jgi:hypothetical protein
MRDVDCEGGNSIATPGGFMSLYKVEYRERVDGEVLESDLIAANGVGEAEAKAKRNFTVVQVNLGARHYQVLDLRSAGVASH